MPYDTAVITREIKMDIYEELTKIKEFLDSGVISEEEYNQLKKTALEGYSKATNLSVDKEKSNTITSNSSINSNYEVSMEDASGGMKALSFLIPIVGLILFLIDRDKKPKAAKDELVFAGAGFVIGLILVTLI